MKPWQDERFYRNDDGLWDFLPPIHRPDQPSDWDGKYLDKTSNWRPLHDDFPIMKTIPRTWTSFIFVDAKLISGDTTNWFDWRGGHFPKPWNNAGEVQVTEVTYKNPITGKVSKGIYRCFPLAKNILARTGPRISDDIYNGPGYVYVNVIPVPILGDLLTWGVKKV